MAVLIACEESGVVRDAFIARGHDAISCDILPTDRPGPHLRQDVGPLLRERWDMVIAFPPCTYLCNSGVRWLHTEEGRWDRMRAATVLFNKCLNANAPMVAVENPIMHSHARKLVGRKWDFNIQPWQFGHGETKRTCFWTRGLPPLTPTNVVKGRHPRTHLMGQSKNRSKMRSRTLYGVALAMADQWGRLL